MSEKVQMELPHTEELEISKNIQDETHVIFHQIDPEEERKVVRKLDRVILPLMAFVYFFQCKFAHPFPCVLCDSPLN